jgi:hypothetical protein
MKKKRNPFLYRKPKIRSEMIESVYDDNGFVRPRRRKSRWMHLDGYQSIDKDKCWKQYRKTKYHNNDYKTLVIGFHECCIHYYFVLDSLTRKGFRPITDQRHEKIKNLMNKYGNKYFDFVIYRGKKIRLGKFAEYLDEETT